jgi:hypothetical protein
MKVQKLSIVDGILTAEYEKIGKKLVLDLNVLDAKYGNDAKWHGWKQRFGDLKSGDETGSEKYAEVQRLYAHLKEGGDWAMTGQRDTVGIVIEALNRINPKKYPKEKLEAAVAAKPEQVKEWRANASVKAMIATIYAERAKKAADEAEKEEVKIEV